MALALTSASMPRRPQPPPTNPAVTGCSFSDVVKWTDATRSNLIHWTNIRIIVPDLEDTAGPGYPRRFSTLNVLEVQLAAEMNRFRLPAALIGDTVWSFRSFHELAMGLHPLLRGQHRLTPEQRTAVERAYLRSVVRRDERHGMKVTKKQIAAYTDSFKNDAKLFNPESEAEMLHHAESWHRFMTDAAYRRQHFYGVFVYPDDEDARIIDEPINVREALGVSTIVLDLGKVIDYLNQVGPLAAPGLVI